MQNIGSVAAVIAAIAAIGYLATTIWMVFVMKDTSKKQARVAELMESDLRFRVAPSLRFDVEGGQVTDRWAFITNKGLGSQPQS